MMGANKPMTVAASALLAALLWLIPGEAYAQYKNISFGIDGGYELITRPPVPEEQAALNQAYLPLRLRQGVRIGVEANVKMHADHWWVNGRANFHLLNFRTSGDNPDSYEFKWDKDADAKIGTVLGVEGHVGVRYYLLTDRVRPYIQPGISYMHFFNFAGENSSCDANSPTLCGSPTSTYLYHTNILSLHAQPGVEFIISRDLALNISLDAQHWIVFNADDNTVFTLAAGFTIYG